MKKRIIHLFSIGILALTSCVTIPKETVILSETLGNDLKALHKSHRNCIEIYYTEVKNNINSLIDNVYAPFIIHFVLKGEMDRYRKGDTSLFKIIEIAAQKEGRKESDDVLNSMLDFQTAARYQIESKRNELLSPVSKQEYEILLSIDQSYENAINANSAITGYLQSIGKVKEAQQEVLSKLGLGGADTIITHDLIKLSEIVDQALEEGKKIDIKSDEAYKQLDAITNKIKKLTNKNN